VDADLTAQEVAKITSLHPITVRRLCREGKIVGAYQVGASWRIRREALQELRGITDTDADGD